MEELVSHYQTHQIDTSIYLSINRDLYLLRINQLYWLANFCKTIRWKESLVTNSGSTKQTCYICSSHVITFYYSNKNYHYICPNCYTVLSTSISYDLKSPLEIFDARYRQSIILLPTSRLGDKRLILSVGEDVYQCCQFYPYCTIQGLRLHCSLCKTEHSISYRISDIFLLVCETCILNWIRILWFYQKTAMMSVSQLLLCTDILTLIKTYLLLSIKQYHN